jgi:hypothetical protein
VSADDIVIDVGMDPSGYLSGAQQIQAASAAMSQSFGQVTGTSGTVRRALDLVTPGRVGIAAWGAMAAGAAGVQQSLGGLRATSVVTGVDLGKLTGTMHDLSQNFPVGTAGAQALVTQFTQLGVAGKGTESQIAALSNTMINLGAATTTAVPDITQGMADISRATGNNSLDNTKISALGDSLTKVAATSGASADSILAFGKNIAPMANVAGIGGAAVLGISGAFARLGDDGIGASTAVNTMLNGMNKSIRDGTPDIAVYASAIGDTTKQFTELYKTNPAEALTQVTEAIAKSASGPRLLEQLGLDSTRTMKSLTALSASGGLRPAIAASLGAYGSGLSAQAGASAMDGLNSSASELSSTMQNLGDALGTPLLGPLTLFTKALTVPAKALEGFASNAVVQKAATVALDVAGIGAIAVAGGALMKGVPSLLSYYGLGRQAVTSMPVSGYSAGLAQGRQDLPGSRTSIRGAAALRAMGPEYVTDEMPYGNLGLGPTGTVAKRAVNLGRMRGAAQLASQSKAWGASSEGRAFAASPEGQVIAVQATPDIWSKGTKATAAEIDEETGHTLKAAQPAVAPVITTPARAAVTAGDYLPTQQEQYLLARNAPVAAPIEADTQAGMSGLRRGGLAIKGAAFNLLQSSSLTTAAQLDNGRLPADQRSTLWGNRLSTEAHNVPKGALGPEMASDRVGLSAGTSKAVDAYHLASTEQGGGAIAGFLPGLKAMGNSFANDQVALKNHSSELDNGTKAVGNFRGSLSAIGTQIRASGSMISQIGQDAKAGVGTAGKLAGFGGSMLSSMGPMLAIAGVAAVGSKLWSDHQDSLAATAATQNAFGASDVNATINAYRESIGQAPQNVTAVNSVAGAAPMVAQPTIASVTGAVTPTELVSAKTGHIQTHYSGSDQSIVHQIVHTTPGGYNPDTAEALRMDLLRNGVKPADVSMIMGTVKNQGKITMPPTEGPTPWSTSKGSALLPSSAGADLVGEVGSTTSLVTVKGGVKAPQTQPLTAAQQATIAGTVHGLGSQTGVETQRAGSVAAAQGEYRSATQMYTSAKAAGASPEVLADLSQKLFSTLNPSDKNANDQTPITADEATKFLGKGGSGIAGLIEARTPQGAFSAALRGQQAAGLSTAATGGVSGATLPGNTALMLTSAGDKFGAGLFNQNNTTKFAEALAASVVTPGSGQDTQSVVNMAIAQYGGTPTVKGATPAASNTASVDSMNKTIQAMNVTLGTLPVGSPEAAALTTAQGALQAQVAVKTQDQTPAAASQSSLQASLAAAQTPIGPTTSAQTVAAQKQGVTDTAATVAADKQRMEARLEVQYQYDTQVDRTNAAFQVSQNIQEASYQRQVVNTTYSYNLSAARAQQDFNTQQTNAQADYDLSRHNEVRDFNISMARNEADYLLTRTNAIRDFNINVARMVQQSAANLYDPYTRIQTKATWDIQNLMSNMAQQSQALVKQKAQLDALRKEGVTQQVIDELKLGDVSNAQQVNQMVSDLAGSPSAVKALNAQGATTYAAAGAMTTDASNVAYVQSTQDFNKQMKDAAIAQATATKRAQQDLAKGLSDQLVAFNISISRSTVAYDLSVTRGQADFSHSLFLMAQEQGIAQQNARDALGVSLANMHTDLVHGDTVINGDLADVSKAFQATMAGKSKAYTSLLVNDSTAFSKNLTTVALAAQALLGPLGIAIPGVKVAPASLATGSMANKVNAQNGRAEGGTIGGYSPTPKADNIPIWATAGEYMHPVDAVNYYGVDTMEALRTKKIPKEALAGYFDGGWVGMWDWAHPRLPGVEMTSNYRPGGTSYHAQGSAIDLAPPSMHVFDTILNAFGNRIAELIYTPAGDLAVKNGKEVGMGFYGAATAAQHYNHVHWAMYPEPAGTMIEANPAGTNPISGSTSSGGTGLTVPSGGVLTKAMLWDKMDHKRKGLYKILLDTEEKAWNKEWPTGMPVGTGTANASFSTNVTGATSHNADVALGQKMAAARGWVGPQFNALNELWTKESGWRWNASNGNSGPDSGSAYGIPQSLPGSKMASSGADWRTNPATQIDWGLGYIAGRYVNPIGAWAHEVANNWYDNGGKVQPGQTLVNNGTGTTEALLTSQQWDIAKAMLTREQSQSMSTAAGTHMTVNHHEQITYDHRNDFGGAKFTVMSNNPDDMAAQLSKKAIAQRLNQTRGVAWTTPATS